MISLLQSPTGTDRSYSLMLVVTSRKIILQILQLTALRYLFKLFSGTLNPICICLAIIVQSLNIGLQVAHDWQPTRVYLQLAIYLF